MSSGTADLVFVYGTLRKSASNHWRMEGAEYGGMGTVRGRLYRIDWYPGLVLDAAGDEVVGELYGVPPGMLAPLDEFEGEEFERVRAMVTQDDGCEIEGWVYAYRGDVTGLTPQRPADWLQAEE